MYTKKHLLFIFIGLAVFSLAAQPITGDIDLGGEDTAVGPLKPPPITQTAQPAAWLDALLRGDTLWIQPPVMYGLPFFNALVENPGSIRNYDALNIFVYLEDERDFFDYLMNRAYVTRTASPRTRTAVQSNSRSTRQTITSSGKRPQRPTQGSQVLAAPADPDRAALASYPLVRASAVGSRGLTKNPAYRSKTVSRDQDAAYAESFAKFTNILSLYQLALVQPDDPSVTPLYLFDGNRKALDYDLPYAANRMGAAVKAKMMIEYRNMHRGAWRSPSFPRNVIPENEKGPIIAKISAIPLSEQDRALVMKTKVVLLSQLQSLQATQANLATTYREHYALLSQQEQKWFVWILRSMTYQIQNLDATASYLGEIERLPLSSTNYGQLLTATDLLRQTHERIRNLPYETEASTVLRNLTSAYLEQVKTVKRVYTELQSN